MVRELRDRNDGSTCPRACVRVCVCVCVCVCSHTHKHTHTEEARNDFPTRIFTGDDGQPSSYFSLSISLYTCARSISLSIHTPQSLYIHTLSLYIHTLSLYTHTLSLYTHTLSVYTHKHSLYRHTLSLYIHTQTHSLYTLSLYTHSLYVYTHTHYVYIVPPTNLFGGHTLTVYV
jgi:hypothetical protein